MITQVDVKKWKAERLPDYMAWLVRRAIEEVMGWNEAKQKTFVPTIYDITGYGPDGELIKEYWTVNRFQDLMANPERWTGATLEALMRAIIEWDRDGFTVTKILMQMFGIDKAGAMQLYMKLVGFGFVFFAMFIF